MSETCNWAAVMAGGDGRRLQAFTQLIAGDSRPKQFCRLFGGRSLLEDTRSRVCRNVEPWRTVYVVTRHHERFYRSELADVPRAHVIEQPENRGTAAAILYTLRRVSLLGPDPAIGFFPADHYFRDTERLRRAVDAAYAVAHAQPERIVMCVITIIHYEGARRCLRIQSTSERPSERLSVPSWPSRFHSSDRSSVRSSAAASAISLRSSSGADSEINDADIPANNTAGAFLR